MDLIGGGGGAGILMGLFWLIGIGFGASFLVLVFYPLGKDRIRKEQPLQQSTQQAFRKMGLNPISPPSAAWGGRIFFRNPLSYSGGTQQSADQSIKTAAFLPDFLVIVLAIAVSPVAAQLFYKMNALGNLLAFYLGSTLIFCIFYAAGIQLVNTASSLQR